MKDEMIPYTLSMFQVDRLSYMKPCIEVTLMYFMRLGKEKPAKSQKKVQFCKMKIIIYTFAIVKIQYTWLIKKKAKKREERRIIFRMITSDSIIYIHIFHVLILIDIDTLTPAYELVLKLHLLYFMS